MDSFIVTSKMTFCQQNVTKCDYVTKTTYIFCDLLAIKEVNYNVKSSQNGKSIMLMKEKHKVKIGNLIAHHFNKILIYIYIFYLICSRLSLAFQLFDF